MDIVEAAAKRDEDGLDLAFSRIMDAGPDSAFQALGALAIAAAQDRAGDGLYLVRRGGPWSEQDSAPIAMGVARFLAAAAHCAAHGKGLDDPWLREAFERLCHATTVNGVAMVVILDSVLAQVSGPPPPAPTSTGVAGLVHLAALDEYGPNPDPALAEPRAAGRCWTFEDWSALAVRLARPDLTLERIAAAHGCGELALRLVVHRRLIPAGVLQTPATACEWVRAKLITRQPYHWQGVLAERLIAAGRSLSTPTAERNLTDLWSAGLPLAAVAAQMRADPVAVAARLVDLGVAGTTDLVTRVGAESGEPGWRALLLAEVHLDDGKEGRPVWSTSLAAMHPDLGAAAAHVLLLRQAADHTQLPGQVGWRLARLAPDPSAPVEAWQGRVQVGAGRLDPWELARAA
jgi:hypothetical protein